MFEEMSVGMAAIAAGVIVAIGLGYAAKYIGIPPIIPIIMAFILFGFGVYMLWRQAT